MSNDIIYNDNTIDLQAYGEWRDQLVYQIRQMRFRAAMQLNASNLAHYFRLGQEIISKQQQMGWGKGVIKMLSADLTREFGKGSGYSERNLGYMKVFAQEYPDFPILQVPLQKYKNREICKRYLQKYHPIPPTSQRFRKPMVCKWCKCHSHKSVGITISA